MTNIPHGESYPIALDNDANIATQVGLLLSSFAYIELYPDKLLAKLIGISIDDAKAIMGWHRNFSDRVFLLERLASFRQTSDLVVKGTQLCCDHMKKCLTIRNDFSHGLYTQHGDSQLNTTWKITTWAVDARRKSAEKYIDAKRVKDNGAVLRSTLFYLQNFVDRNSMPPPISSA